MASSIGGAREILGGARMTESELWLEVAERWASPDPWHTGLCCTLAVIEMCSGVSSYVADQAGGRCSRYMVDPWGYVYPPGEELMARSLAALWMAFDAAEDEGKAGAAT